MLIAKVIIMLKTTATTEIYFKFFIPKNCQINSAVLGFHMFIVFNH